MTIEVREESIADVATQADISIAFTVDRVLAPTVTAEGITFREEHVAEPWVKDYDANAGHGPADWPRTFDVSRWGLLVARDGEERVGGTVVAFDTPGCDLLRRRRDLAVVWDLRVQPGRRASGIGSRLWPAAEAWARDRGCSDIEVETQNINVGACRFYAAMGCTIGVIDRFAYAPDLPDEIQLRWHKRL